MKLCFAAFAVAVLGWGWAVQAGVLPDVNAGAVPRDGVRLEISSVSPEFTAITMRDPEVAMEEATVDYETYHVFRLPGEPVLFREGAPAVPQVSRYYRVPNTGGVDLNVTAAEYELVEGVIAFPVQADAREFHGLVKDPGIYGEDAWYPPNVAEVSAPMIMRDFRVVIVTLYPVQVNPITGQARVYHTLEAELAGTDEPSENELLVPRRPSANWSSSYRSLIANLDDNALDDVTETPGSYLILCNINPVAREWADSLALWKRQQGFDVVIDARSNWSAVAMRTAIQNAYAEWDPPLEFVCLIGDPDWSYGVPSDGAYANYDHTFALGNAGDDLEDIGVGRLSGSGSSEMATITGKYRAYERDPHMVHSTGVADTSWFHRGLFYAGIGQGEADNWLLMQWAEQQYENYTGIDLGTAAFHNGPVNESFLRPFFSAGPDSGIGLFIWQGSWVGQMQSTFPGTLPGNFKLPIVLSISEGTGDFIGGSTCHAEAWITAGTYALPRGAVAAIGLATLSSQWHAQRAFTASFVHEMAHLQGEYLGQMVAAAKNRLRLAYGENQQGHNMVRWINLIGEPSLAPWNGVPVVMSAERPDTVTVGERGMVVTVSDPATGAPVVDALVVLLKQNETYARELTDAGGAATLPVMINSVGDLTLTVTKRQHKPYHVAIPCVLAPRHVALSTYALDDDNEGGTSGNGDGAVNPGEIIDISGWVRNYGIEDWATGVNLTLSSGSPSITVVHAMSAAPALSPGDSAQYGPPFRIQVSPQIRHGETALLTLTAITDQDTTRSLIELTGAAGALMYVAHAFDMPLNPGTQRELRVTLRNTGAASLSGVTASVASDEAHLVVNDGDAAFGNISAGQQAANTADPFVISAPATVIPGQQASLRLIATAAGGAADTMYFTVTIGTPAPTDPAGPDAYGYYAFDNTDLDYAQSPEFEYVDISSGPGTFLELNDVGEKTVITQLWSVARELPFPFTFYGESYDTITVCSNGWVAFGNQEWNDMFENYPIPGLPAPDAQIAVYWDDLKTLGPELGVWDYHDTANDRYIVQWKAQGAFDTTHLDFQVILLDEDAYPTPDGNGKVLVQYMHVTMGLQGEYTAPLGCTVGIQSPGGFMGLQYAYLLAHSPGAAPLEDGRAILFMSLAEPSSGSEPPVAQLPSRFALHPNFPNPFNPSTRIRFDVPQTGEVLIEIFNTLGQRVATLADARYPAGSYSVEWDGSARSSGLYICRMRAGEFAAVQKLLMVR